MHIFCSAAGSGQISTGSVRASTLDWHFIIMRRLLKKTLKLFILLHQQGMSSPSSCFCSNANKGLIGVPRSTSHRRRPEEVFWHVSCCFIVLECCAPARRQQLPGRAALTHFDHRVGRTAAPCWFVIILARLFKKIKEGNKKVAAVGDPCADSDWGGLKHFINLPQHCLLVTQSLSGEHV